jgi:transcriptional regulator with XRE-family HTH domain
MGRAQGTKHNSALAVWLNRVGMTSREFQRRLGDKSMSRLSRWLSGEEFPGLPMAYEIERITEGGVPMEAWLASKGARAILKTMRDKQPEEFRPAKDDLEDAEE